MGYARTLQATDLYKVDKSRSAEVLSNGLEEAWKRRVEAAKVYNERLEKGEVKPGLGRRGVWWSKRILKNCRRSVFGRKGSGERGKELTKEEQELKWRKAKRKRASLVWALNDVIGSRFWIAGIYKVRKTPLKPVLIHSYHAYIQVFGDTAQLMAPLLVRTIITFSERRFAAASGSGTKAQPLVEGIFMAVGLFILSNIQNFGQQHVCVFLSSSFTRNRLMIWSHSSSGER